MAKLEHDFPFDPTYGYDREALLRIAPPANCPSDFADFWRGLYAAARTIDPAPEWDGPETIRSECRVRKIRYTSYGGRGIGGWLVTPLEGEIRRLVVAGHGYGGEVEPRELLMEGVAVFHFCARGLPELSLFNDIPSLGHFHVITGIESRESYVLGHCCADLWLAASALVELVGRPDLPLHYWGGSFGGGLGALALPWDDRFTAAYLFVPSFGNHPVRLAIPCTGSGESVRRYWLRKPAIAETTLPYFDAAHAAAFLKTPTFYACALFDPGVPPPGQFSVWQAHAGPKELFIFTAGHFEYEGRDAEIAEAESRARAYLMETELRR